MERITDLYGYLAEYGVLITEDDLQDICDTLNAEKGLSGSQ